MGQGSTYLHITWFLTHAPRHSARYSAIDGTGSHGKWPAPSPGPPDSLVEDRPLCRDRTSASQTLTGRSILHYLAPHSCPPSCRAERIPQVTEPTCRANINARQERMKPPERIIRRREIILNPRQNGGNFEKRDTERTLMLESFIELLALRFLSRILINS